MATRFPLPPIGDGMLESAPYVYPNPEPVRLQGTEAEALRGLTERQRGTLQQGARALAEALVIVAAIHGAAQQLPEWRAASEDLRRLAILADDTYARQLRAMRGPPTV